MKQFRALTDLLLKSENVYVKKGEVFSFENERSESAIQKMISAGMIEEIIEDDLKINRKKKESEE